jgi:group II intron reverse transcriptase/maturase
MLLTPEKIRTLQRKLYRKAKLEPGYRFYALYDKVYREDILSHAYGLVRSKKGAPGVDGVSFDDLEAEEGVEALMAKLREDLRSKKYRADAVRRVWIPKPDGKKRPLGIPTVRDRIVQMAVKIVIEPIFEADFCDCSYGFRPKRSAHNAIDDVADGLHKGYGQVIDADLAKYFDMIPHAKLMRVLAERIADGRILALIKQWLKAPIVEEDETGRRGTHGGKGNRRGTPQGGVISPLLANLYLHLLDRVWTRNDLSSRLQTRLVRYADDVVLLCAGSVREPMEILRNVLDRLDLSLNEEKSKVLNSWEESFGFLGFSVVLRKSKRSGKFYPHVEPSKESVQRIKERVKGLTIRQMTPVPLPELIKKLNETLRGWSGYYHYRNCTKSFNKVKWYVEERVRTHLRKRHKIKSRAMGYKRFPNKVLYNRYGLFKLPTTAGWT